VSAGLVGSVGPAALLASHACSMASGGTNSSKFLNSRFDIGVVFMLNYFLVEDDIFVDNDPLLMTDFINLKIKLTQSFKGAYKNRMYVHMFIELGAHMCMNICVCL
jgi:hypothetical protein